MIDLSNVSFAYEGSDEPSVTSVDLKVAPGEVVVLCGRSGCGKTTVTRIVNGLAGDFYAGTRSGSVLIDGRETSTLEPWQVSAHVGSVFQNPRTQFFNLDTTGEIAFGMENRGDDRDKMHAQMLKVARELAIAPLLDRDIFALSGGQKQAIAFASVHAMEPSAYVLDEPSSNLDDASMDDLARFIMQAKQKGAAVLVAEHRLAYLSSVADRFVLMEGGRVTRQWNAAQFARLGEGERSSHGLRSPSPPSIGPLAHRLSAPLRGQPLCEARELVAGYGRNGAVLDRCTVGFGRGCVTGLVGGNGAGKTTLLSCLCGLKKESGGRVCFEGEAVSPRHRPRQAFLVMQDPDYQLFRASVRAELSCAPHLRSPVEDMRVDAMLHRFGLYDMAGRHPSSLSGGQKQRTVCAMAALSPARVLLFDEPTSGLDFDSMQRLASTMRELAEEGRAVVAVSHDTEFLSAACDRIVQLE